MNRREFLKTTLIALLPIDYSELIKEKELERCLEDTKDMTDDEIVAWVTIQVKLYCVTPGMCALITNIEEP